MHTLNLKIYGVTTVWQKGQVIIPKESRKDLNVKEWEEFKIVLVDNTAFWISISWDIHNNCDLEHKTIEFEGNITIWSKFQFVIPSVIRTSLWITPKDNLVVIWKWEEGIAFIKNDNIEYLFDYIKESIKNQEADK